MRVQKEKANAKINLYLDVIAMREDGFHDIKSVMHSVTLCDEISIKYVPSKQTSIKICVIGNRYLPTDSKNLAYKAAILFLEKASLTAKLEITILKRIPIAAGLAGGSADAAAVLKGLNKIFGRIFSEKALISMGSELGSDIPFCLYGKTALCEGRGEIITKLPVSLKSHFVIAVANEHVSTPAAYKQLDEIYSSFDGSVKTGGDEYYKNLIDGLQTGDIVEKNLFNIFETAVLPMCEGAKSIKKLLLDYGAEASMMSGSGPSVFGVFRDEKTAQDVCEKLKDEGIKAFYAQSAT